MAKKQLPQIVLLAGPTASGKTQLALELAEKIPIEIVSVDSAMIYKGMDIGTGKPEREILAKVPHHLIDILEPQYSYSVAQFCHDAQHAISSILSRNKIPVLVGGTMMYFKGFKEGLAELPSASPAVRDKLQRQLVKQGLLALHERLKAVDPIMAERIHPNDPQRILRALEIYETTHKPMSQHLYDAGTTPIPYEFISIAIAPLEREILHQRIATRFMQMLEQGFVQEVQNLRAKGNLNKHMPSMRSVGYRQVWQYIDEEFSYEVMTDKAIIATRQLAKRQYTWLRSFNDLNWFDSEQVDLCSKIISFLQTQHRRLTF